MKYLSIDPKHPKVAVFDFTSCEGCELQLTNKEETLVPFLQAIQVVNFREASSERRDDYEIAFIEGAISRPDEVDRLKKIRAQAGVLVALGTCAVFGGVNKLKNSFDLKEANREVYGDKPKETMAVKPIKDYVTVDLEIPGCPVLKEGVERIVQHVLFDVPYSPPVYSVCYQCKQNFTTCMFEKGNLCLGPIVRGGCNAPCPAGGLGCLGCRGPAAEPNYEGFFTQAMEKNFTKSQISEYLGFFGAFEGVMK